MEMHKSSTQRKRFLRMARLYVEGKTEGETKFNLSENERKHLLSIINLVSERSSPPIQVRGKGGVGRKKKTKKF